MLHKILIVDDEEQVRNTIRLQLKETDYVLIEAEDGAKAIEVLKDENVLEIVAIICDVRMPKLGGVEAIAYFRREYPSIPVIVLTGYPDVKLAVEFMKESVVDYLVKPVEKEKLIEVVAKAVSQKTLFSGSESS
jgi:DNA-binding NtrC family response regulator